MLFQLCYASKITATGTQALSDLRDILDEARHFNLQHDIHGVLYFGEGYFIQCLEGQQDIIWALYEKICTDPRHQHNMKKYVQIHGTSILSFYSLKRCSTRALNTGR